MQSENNYMSITLCKQSSLKYENVKVANACKKPEYCFSRGLARIIYMQSIECSSPSWKDRRLDSHQALQCCSFTHFIAVMVCYQDDYTICTRQGRHFYCYTKFLLSFLLFTPTLFFIVLLWVHHMKLIHKFIRKTNGSHYRAFKYALFCFLTIIKIRQRRTFYYSTKRMNGKCGWLW